MLDTQFDCDAIFTSPSDAEACRYEHATKAASVDVAFLRCNPGESRQSFESRVGDIYGWTDPRYDAAHFARFMSDRESVWTAQMRRESRAHYLAHGVAESFWDAAFESHAQGWQTVPQDRTPERLPCLMRGQGRVRWGVYTTQRLVLNDVEQMNLSAGGQNVAFVSGPAQAGAFAVDNDISGIENAAVVRRLFDTFLGATPFERTRLSSTRFLRVYRGDGIKLRKIKTLAGDVEILGQSSTGTGSLFTAHGIHGKDASLPREELHRGQFLWTTSPRRAPPTDATFVTESQIDRLEEALHEAFGQVAEPERRVIEPARFDGKLLVPGGGTAIPGVGYVDGLATDGREQYLTDRTYAWFVHNPAAPLDVLTRAVADEARLRIKIDGRWTGLDREIEKRLAQLQRKHASGGLKVRATYRGEDGAVYSSQPVTPTSSSDLDITALAGTKRTAVKLASATAVNALVAAQRALMDDKARAVETTRVALAVRDGIQAWLDALWSKDDEAAERLLAVWLMIAPTGAGKTTTLLRLLAEQVAARGPLGQSVCLMLPSYANIAEAEGRMAEFVAEAKTVGLRSIVYKGKIAGGCLVAEQMTKLMSAGIGTSGLCEADVDVCVPGEGMETEHQVCDHAHVCPVLENRREAQECDLLLMPMAFMRLPMQKAVRDSIAAIVVDERSWPEFIEHRTFPIDALTLPRGGVYATDGEIDDVIYPGETPKSRKARRNATAAGDIVLTDAQRERRKGVRIDVVAAMQMGRDAIAAVAMKAIRDGKRVAQVVLDHRRVVEGRTVTGREMAEDAKRVCGRSADRRKSVKPNMTAIAVDELATAPRGSWLWQEVAFWNVVLDDMDRLEKGIATGDTDARLQLQDRDEKCDVDAKDSQGHPIVVGEAIRVSWRTKSTFENKPAMLMDASASPEIVAKLWGGREVQTIRIDAPLHMRTVWCPDSTWADSYYCPSKSGDDETKRASASRALYHLRNVIVSLGGLFGHGHVVVGSTKTGRDEIFREWPGPENVRSMHSGAVAGLDFAKHDLAALCVGRLEVPIRVVDAVVAALTYDDAIPELPIDRNGNGLGDDGKGLRPTKGLQQVPMRDGSDVSVLVPMHQGHWARIVQRQHREENTRQFIGRLRPVYREGEPPLVVIMSSIVPDGIVVDEIIHSLDLAANSKLWESVRRREMLEPAGAGVDMDLRSPDGKSLGEFDILMRARAELHSKGVDGTRIGKGLVEVEAVFKGGARKRLYLPAFADTKSFEQRYVSYWREDRLLGVNVVKRGAPVSASIERPVDVAFEARVGTWEERVEAERVTRIAGMTRGIETMLADETFANMRLGVGEERGPLGVKLIMEGSRRKA
jgi:hypothetical protein